MSLLNVSSFRAIFEAKEDISSIPQELSDYVNAQPVLRIATLEGDMPHVTPVWFAYDGQAFYIASDHYVKKITNIKNHSKVSVEVDTYNLETWEETKGIMFRGEAELIPIVASPEHEKARKLLKEKYPAYAKEYAAWLEGNDPESRAVVIKVVPESYTTWGFED